MRAYVRLRLSSGQTAVLGPGDLVGRLSGASLQIDDGRVSEAHAMVSLRGRELKLLGLRGVFAVDGKPTDEVVLAEELAIELAPGLSLHVEEIVLPDTLLAVEGDGLPRQVLTGSMSLMLAPEPALVPRARFDAAALGLRHGTIQVYTDSPYGAISRFSLPVRTPHKHLLPSAPVHLPRIYNDRHGTRPLGF